MGVNEALAMMLVLLVFERGAMGLVVVLFD